MLSDAPGSLYSGAFTSCLAASGRAANNHPFTTSARHPFLPGWREWRRAAPRINIEAGNTYSFDEIAGWLTEAGFTNPRQLPSPGPSPLILATRG